ncbi:hypothetical protein [Aquimarina algiphila]|uniref:Lipoprotein n=1 Tax=Aquimarina algiphila TaxID=2047982 RepID=A0A554VDY7_9FLAO|nr:hypothetical protein [Aquimarina algiphila]TSE05208.1 hypothetical protein FOF46_23380 [Aquimarina algiphila]
MKKQFIKILLKLTLILSVLFICSCSAQQEEEIDPILEELKISDCDYSLISGTEIVKSKIKFLSSTQIFDSENKQGVVSVFYEIEYDGQDYNLNFHTESNIFDNYLGFRNSDISNHEVEIGFYFEGVEKIMIAIANKVDLIESKNLIKPDSFIGYTFSIENVNHDLLESLNDKKLIKFSIHEDMFGIYSSYRKDVSKEIKCLTYANR